VDCASTNKNVDHNPFPPLQKTRANVAGKSRVLSGLSRKKRYTQRGENGERAAAPRGGRRVARKKPCPRFSWEKKKKKKEAIKGEKGASPGKVNATTKKKRGTGKRGPRVVLLEADFSPKKKRTIKRTQSESADLSDSLDRRRQKPGVRFNPSNQD